jgi:hypothetical protein
MQSLAAVLHCSIGAMQSTRALVAQSTSLRAVCCVAGDALTGALPCYSAPCVFPLTMAFEHQGVRGVACACGILVGSIKKDLMQDCPPGLVALTRRRRGAHVVMAGQQLQKL